MSSQGQLKIDIAAPHSPQTQTGNRTTSTRWRSILTELGHDVQVVENDPRSDADLLVALHATKTRPQIDAFAHRNPNRPIIIALSGTDIYGDLHTDSSAIHSLDHARRIIALQPLAKNELPTSLHDRTCVIYQSVQLPEMNPAVPNLGTFEVCIVANLREVKDPFLAARAAALLPSTSRIHITQVGAALSPDFEKQAIELTRKNPRYDWIGPKPWQETMKRLADSDLMVISSKSEGGANVIGEACTLGTPILATRIPGNTGLLGEDYPGLFEVGNERELARLLTRAESGSMYYDELTHATRARRELFTPQRERAAWKNLLDEITNEG